MRERRRKFAKSYSAPRVREGSIDVFRELDRVFLVLEHHKVASPLPKPRVFPGLDDMIVLGGGDVFEQHANGERYKSQEDAWFEVSPMLTKRVRHVVAVAHGKVFALGGKIEHIFLLRYIIYLFQVTTVRTVFAPSNATTRKETSGS